MRMITFSRIWHRIGQIVELDIYRRQFGQIWQLRKAFVAIAGDSFFSFATRVIVSSIYIILRDELHDDFLSRFLSSIEIPWTIYLQFAITIIRYLLSCSDKLFSINGEIMQTSEAENRKSESVYNADLLRGRGNVVSACVSDWPNKLHRRER